jgi:excinuclease ABC subunit C
MVNARRELIYVGKAKCLRARLLSYFRSKSRDAKAGRILGHTRSLVWEYAPSEFAALLRELELIRRWEPRFNVQGQPARRRPTYVCLGRRPAPHAFLSRQPTSSALACFGPVSAGWQAREAVRRLNDWFGLRDCPRAQEMVFAEQQELFPVVRAAGCLRYEIGTCLGPCLGTCTRSDYMARVRAAQAFLAGRDLALLQSLKRDMVTASAALAFEQAASLRDQLETFTWLHEQLDRLRLACEQKSFIYPVPGYEGQNLWYLIRGGRAVGAVPAPHDAASRQAVRDALQGTFEQRHPAGGPLPVDEMDGVLLVAGWFRRNPEERTRTLALAQALAACGEAITP